MKTREKLVLVAFELFHRQGFHATGVSQILKQSGVHSGSLYYFFPTKEDLLLAVLAWCKENLWPELIDPVFARVSDPIERVFGILDGYRQMLILTGCRQGCPMGNLALELADSHAAVRRLLAENFDGWRAAVRQCLADAQERFPEPVDFDALSLFVLTTMEGAVMLARTYQSLEPYDTAILQLRDYFDRIMGRASSRRNAPVRAGPQRMAKGSP